MSPPAEPHVTIGLREIYDAVLRVEAKTEPLPAKVRDHESRVRRLEQKVWALPAAGALIGALAGWVGRGVS